MGTSLYDRGVFINRCFDELNLSNPDLVRDVHREFVKAGAEIIETNTYGANRIKLTQYGLEERLGEINRRGVELAREVAGEQCFVAGSMGPTGLVFRRVPEEEHGAIAAAFREQAEHLVSAGVDLIMLETFSYLDELVLALRAVREVAADLPVVAQASFETSDATHGGERPEDVALTLEREGATLIGANCSTGPKDLLEVARRMAAVSDLPLSIQPNAGPPQLVEGRYLYLTTPEYLAEYARRFALVGARIVGGCCGTSPRHIREVATYIRSISGKQEVAFIELDEEAPAAEGEVMTPVPAPERSPFARRLLDPESFVTSVEIAPPRGTNARKVLEAVRLLREHGVDAVNIPDGPRATARVSPMALAFYLRQEVGIEVILHYCCRDRNLLGMQADLMGADLLGLRNVLLVTGDPPKLGDYPDATAVFDVDSIGLTRIANRLNHGQDLAANPLGSQTALFIGVGVNPAAVDIDLELDRFDKKLEAGAEFVLTQPVFDQALIQRFLEHAAGKDIPIMVGVLPLASYRNAQFLHNEVPGMHIPDEILERMRRAGDGKRAREEGIRIAREMLEAVRELPGVRGVYVMPPFGRVRMALRVLGLL
jgi:homocysteine S-methyltransferase